MADITDAPIVDNISIDTLPRRLRQPRYGHLERHYHDVDCRLPPIRFARAAATPCYADAFRLR